MCPKLLSPVNKGEKNMRKKFAPEDKLSEWWSRSCLAVCSQQACIYVFMQVFAHGCANNLMYACECVGPSESAIRGERGRTCWPSPISHALCFLLHPLPPPTPALASPRISLWSPHSAYSLSSVCLSVSLTALPPQRLRCLDRKALRQLPTITSRP